VSGCDDCFTFADDSGRLNNTYNYLAPNSPLRAPTLLALLALLARSSELPALPLTPSTLTSALSQWPLSQSDKVAFLTRAATIYQSAEQLSRALEISILALAQGAEKSAVEKAIVLALSVENNLSLDEVLRVNGVQALLEGKLKELVALFTEVDEIEAVGKGKDWLASNGSYVESFGEPRTELICIRTPANPVDRRRSVHTRVGPPQAETHRACYSRCEVVGQAARIRRRCLCAPD
jgi:hypothetical protein